MTEIFDGKAYAEKKLKVLSYKANRLLKKGVKPKLVSILVGDNPGSLLYLKLKKKAAERIGAEVEIVKLPANVAMNRFIATIRLANEEKSVHGVMIQLPLPRKFSEKDRRQVIDSIAKEKDVDGLRDDSSFMTPTVKAVLAALYEAKSYISPKKQARVLVVGYTGFEGTKIYKKLKKLGYIVEGADINTKNLKLKTKSADVIISVTGVADLIKSDMVKNRLVLIDVGAPGGDIAKDAYNKASFVSPIPGGIGPVTISCLLENLINSVNI